MKVIIIAIRDIWIRFEEESQALTHAGLSVEDAVKMAFGYAALSNRRPWGRQTVPVAVDIFTAVRNLLIDRLPMDDDRLPFTRQSGYGVNDMLVYRVVDIIGEISHMLSNAVIMQLGQFPANLQLNSFTGLDLVLHLNSEDSRVPHPFAPSQTQRPERAG